MANRLRAYRQYRKYTLEELARIVGSSKAYLWQLENKADPDPGVKLAYRLSVALGDRVENIFDLKETSE